MMLRAADITEDAPPLRVRQADPVDAFAGMRFRLARNMRGRSQEWVAEKMGITFQQIQKYERADNRLSASRLHRASVILDVPVSFFFEGAPVFFPKGSFEHAQSETDLVEMMLSKYGAEMARNFARIKDDKVRKRVVLLVKALADESEGVE